MRATEQSGVRSAGSSIGWALVLAVLTALAFQLSALTASASADDLTLVERTQDEAVAAPVAGDDGTTSQSPAADPSESPAADPVPDPEVTSPQPAAPSGPPATVESSQPDAGTRPGRRRPSWSAPTARTQTIPRVRLNHPGRRPVRSIAPPQPCRNPSAATGGGGPTYHACSASRCAGIACAPRGAAPTLARAGMGVATIAWGQPGPLVSGVTVRAWGAVVEWGPPPVSLPAPRAKSPVDPTTNNLVRQTRPQQPPPVPRAPSSSMCGGASSCGASFLVMLPLYMGIVCLCASLFQRLAEAPELWRSTRFLSLRERPG